LRGSRLTQVPKTIMGAEKHIVSRFLMAVFESEATVRKDVPEIEFSTASEHFANDLAYLLLRFGIVARIKPKRIAGNDHVYWRLYISGHRNLKTFENEIRFISSRKKAALGRWTKREIEGSTNKDIMPNIQLLLRKAREKLGLDKSHFYGSKNGYRYELSKNMSRNYLAKIINGKPETKEIAVLRDIAESDVLWDEVIEINASDFDGYVYDLTIGDTHTFIAGFGGIIVHNTYIVKSAAGECKAGFINAKLSDLLDMYVGNTEKNIHKVFELARKNSPCILFFDEVDAIGGRRDQGEGAQYMKMAVNQMLYEMDGVEAHNENVLTIAATNAPWDVDPALRRSGRFSKTIYIPEPDFNSRTEIIKMHSKKRPLGFFMPYQMYALTTMGYASSDLKAIVDEASTFPWLEAFFSMQKKTAEYMKQGMDKAKAEELAKKQVAQRSVNVADFTRALIKKRSSLPPWYEQAKKQIGKQEEVTIVDGKEHKKISDSKMGPGEKEAFKDLLGTINNRNQWYTKFAHGIVKESSLIILRILSLAFTGQLVIGA
ncbi:MAG: AAA family ATPase, partial [Candidatus Micrarchaeota archaeon]